MRFLMITQYFPPEVGAAQTRLAATAKSLVKAGHEVEVVTAMPNYPEGQIAEKYRGHFYLCELWQNLPVHRFWLWAAQGKAGGRLLAYLSLMVTCLAGLRKVQKPDVVFVNSGPLFLGFSGWMYSRFFGVPMIFYVADLWPRSVEHLQGLGARIFLKWALWLEAWIYSKSRYVVAVTEGVRQILISEKGLSEEKVLFLPNGVDTQIFYPRPPAEDLAKRLNLQGKKVFIYAGNHGYAHALECLIETADLLQAHPEVVLLLVGGGSEKSKLLTLAKEKKLKNVVFVDPVSPEVLADYLQISDVGLVHVRNSPLAEETRPAKMFPMMAMGKPILYAGFGEGARLLETVGGGWIVPPGNPQALAEEILKICQQDKVRLQKGQNNFEYVRQNLDFPKLVSDWLQKVRL